MCAIHPVGNVTQLQLSWNRPTSSATQARRLQRPTCGEPADVPRESSKLRQLHKHHIENSYSVRSVRLTTARKPDQHGHHPHRVTRTIPSRSESALRMHPD